MLNIQDGKGSVSVNTDAFLPDIRRKIYKLGPFVQGRDTLASLSICAPSVNTVTLLMVDRISFST
jgi:hypothetical protein